MNELCKVALCERIILVKSQSLCSTHYQRLKRLGKLTADQPYERHGLKNTVIFSIYHNIKKRTTNVGDPAYKNYGGRGIKMCAGWSASLADFANDLGTQPTPKHTVDRIDNSKGYTCGRCDDCTNNGWTLNCRWATREVQSWNRRLSKKNKSGYRGVCLKKGKWTAQMRVKGKYYCIGEYTDIESAAIAYDKYAIFFRGEEAKTNILTY